MLRRRRSGLAAPLVPALDVPWLEPFPDARFHPQARAYLRLAWVAAVQYLPARQRAVLVLVLREVLAFSAAEVAEVAEQLGATVAAVNSALQRERGALAGAGDAGTVTELDDPKVRAVVQRYMRTFDAAEALALVRLPADGAVREMPPVPLWYQGSGTYGRFSWSECSARAVPAGRCGR